MSGFVHLHVHSSFSLLRALPSTSRLIHHAKSQGASALALTDLDSLAGVQEFYAAAKHEGIKPIIGYEATIAVRDGQAGHLTLLAENNIGYGNLLHFASIAGYGESPNPLAPRGRGPGEGAFSPLTLDQLTDLHDGLICLSGCMESPIAQALLDGHDDLAESWIQRLNTCFGTGNFFLELQRTGQPGQDMVNRALVRLAQNLQLPIVATNNVHCLAPDDAEAHAVVNAIRTGSQLLTGQTGVPRLHFRSAGEMEELFADLPQAIANTAAIAARCNVTIDNSNKPVPKPFLGDSGEVLAGICRDLLPSRYPDQPAEAVDRLEMELRVIRETDRADHFLLVYDLVRYARSQDIPVGPGRSEAAGSIVCFILGITGIDPLGFGLIFERFSNHWSQNPPAMFLDLCVERRREVVAYAIRTFGADHVARIGKYTEMSTKRAVRRVGVALGISPPIIKQGVEMAGREPWNDLSRVFKDLPALLPGAEDEPELHQLLRVAASLQDIPCMRDIEPHRFAISGPSLADITPLVGRGDHTVTQFDRRALGLAGVNYILLIGLESLTVAESALKLIEKRTGRRPDQSAIPLDDRRVYDLFCTGDTDDIFHLGWEAMHDIILAIQPDHFGDLMAVIALYRPGPIEAGMVDRYLAVKRGQRRPEYLHPILAPIFDPTHGEWLYSEQVIQALHILSGRDLAWANKFAKAMMRRDAKAIPAFAGEFESACAANGIAGDTARSFTQAMKLNTGNLFQKAHCAAFGLLAYQTAWLKAVYPEEFQESVWTVKKGQV